MTSRTRLSVKHGHMLGILHFAMDFVCITCAIGIAARYHLFHSDIEGLVGLLNRGVPFVFAYNVVAFGMQFPLGVLVDRVHDELKLIAMSFAMTLVVSLVRLLDVLNVTSDAMGAVVTLLLIAIIGLANALFHAAAGEYVLNERDGLAGCRFASFLAPGALGVGVAMAINAMAINATSTSLVTEQMNIITAIMSFCCMLYCLKAAFADEPLFGRAHRVLVWVFGVMWAACMVSLAHWVATEGASLGILPYIPCAVIAVLPLLSPKWLLDWSEPYPQKTVVSGQIFVAIVCFCLSGFIRSFVGIGAASLDGWALAGDAPDVIASFGITLGLLCAIATYAGKMLGGALADFERTAWVSWMAPVLAIPFFVFSGNPIMGWIGIVLLNVPTAFTTCALAFCMPTHKGAMFGLMSLMLVLGALPWMCGMGPFDIVVAVALLVVSTLALLIGLLRIARVERARERLSRTV